MNRELSLERFIVAQEKVYAVALSEISSGQKRSHWMWFIFPQIAGLGFSKMSTFYAIKDRLEAQEYLLHPILGNRLIQISQALLQGTGKDAQEIFGSPDDLKLKSSMTLFAMLPHTHPVFQAVLDKFFSGVPDRATLKITGA